MKNSDKSLALRDPALAAVMGAIALSGTNFGNESSSFGAEFGVDPDDDYAYGAEFGLDAPAAPSAAIVPRPTPQAMQQLWVQHHTKAAAENRRGMLLEPNKGFSTKVEKYGFSINQNLTLAGGVAALNMSGSPDYTIRPKRVTMNAPAPAFCTISEIKVANVSATSSSGSADAFEFGPNGVGQELDLPTITPANKVAVLGSYTNFVPPGYAGGFVFPFTCSFKGWARIVA